MVRYNEESPLVEPTEKNGKLNPLMIGRKVRDLLFLLILIAFCVGMVIIGVFAFIYGDVDRLKYGTDYVGNICGNEGRGKYIYWLDPVNKDNWKYKICVKKCPNNITPLNFTDPANLNNNVRCQYGLQPSLDTNGRLVKGCYPAYNSESVLYRCIPSTCPENPDTGKIPKSCDKVMDDNINDVGRKVERMMSDISNSWKIILVACGFAIVVSFVWLFIVRLFAGLIVWLTLIGLVLSCIAFTIYLFIKAGDLDANDKVDIKPAEDNDDNIRTLGYIFIGITVLLICLIVFMAKRIHFAIKIIQEATYAVNAVKRMVFFPFITTLAIGAFLVWWIFVAIYLASSGNFDDSDMKYEQSDSLKRLMIYHLFGLFWISAFIIAIAQTTMAMVFSTWYWTREPKELPDDVVWQSFSRTLKYHSGSMALGSLILAFVQLIRSIFEYVQHKQEESDQDNPIVKIVGCCIRCCLDCFERFIKFLNKNAYIIIAMKGKSFCASAQEAYEIIFSNILRVGALSAFGDFFLFLGKTFICVISGLFAYIMVDETQDVNEDGNAESPLYPTVLVIFLAYVIASCFMSVYEMAMDTILLCFCIDCDLNDGSSLKPYYMSDSLRGLIKEEGAPK